jgi:hypothetical protein
MPQRTLLDITQDILASMDGEEVNSITDTVESEQVARIIRQTYFHIAPSINEKQFHNLFQLTASGDNTKPVLMTVPATVVDISWIKYDKKLTAPVNSLWEEIYYKPLEEFLDLTDSYNTDETNITSMTHNSFQFKYYTDRHPECYSTIDDNTLIFNSYYSTLDTTLQTSKTRCFGQIDATFTFTDAAVVDIDQELYNLLFDEAKAQAFAELKQTQNTKAEQRARRGWIRSQHDNSVTPNQSYYDRMPNYGRKRP